jgi:hypothetical protein
MSYPHETDGDELAQREPFATDILCQECEDELVKMGSQYYCQRTDCGRFSLPCPETHMGFGYTEEEHEAALEQQRDREARA